MKMRNILKILGLAMLLALVLVPISLATLTTEDNTNPPIAYAEISEVKINGDIAQNGDDLYVARGDTLKVRVTVKALTGDLTDANVEARISGYRYSYYEPDLVSDTSKTFTLPEGGKKSFDLTLEVPMDMEIKDAKLRIFLYDENSNTVMFYNYQLSIDGSDDSNAVEIRDFYISPSTTIEAGRALSFKVKVKNYGTYDLDDLKVKVSIPELDISTFETIDTLEQDETQSFEALLLRIPSDAAPGDYEVVAEVKYDKYQSTEKTQTITVIEPKGTPCSGTSCGSTGLSKTVVTMPASVDVILGSQGSVYPILIENKGSGQLTYVLSASGVSGWGTATFEPSSVFVIPGGQSQTVYLRVVPLSGATAGDNVMKVTITAGNEMKDTTVIASLKQGAAKTQSSAGVKSALEWVLIVLVAVLIILGIIVVARKMRKGSEAKEEEQSYY
jgi:uncharacterized membrane protein